MIITPQETEPVNVYKLMIGAITPRPIAFVSTTGTDGVNNLAPYSFFTGVSANPPAIGFSPMVNREGRKRDSRVNIEALAITALALALFLALAILGYSPAKGMIRRKAGGGAGN